MVIFCSKEYKRLLATLKTVRHWVSGGQKRSHMVDDVRLAKKRTVNRKLKMYSNR